MTAERTSGATNAAEETAMAVDEAAPPPEDARFEDGARPARLLARDVEDLRVVSALLQDAALLLGDMGWRRPQRRFALVANRYRWEEPDALERVRVGVHFDGVLAARVRGVDLGQKSRPVALLALDFSPSEAPEDPGGVVRLTLSGQAEIALDVDALEVVFQDLTRPWRAKRRPAHPDDDAVVGDGA